MNELHVKGFSFAAVKAGFRGKDRLDLGLIYSERPARAVGVFTRNAIKAAPVQLGQERLKNGELQAVMVNSGIANACTGDMGMANARQAASWLAKELGVAEDKVIVSSTGVIGEQFDMQCFERSVGPLVGSLSSEKLTEVSRAMMTTDTVPKSAVQNIQLGGKSVKLVGIAKGAGMIMPNMATMLSFIMTDAAIELSLLQAMLVESVNRSFNRISIDGDMSTNDTVLLLANGMAGNAEIRSGCEEVGIFKDSLDALTKDLALQIVKDGEGATKLVTLQIHGAKDEAEAETAARAIANSSLVKTAFFGQDANWGRIIAALGYSGVSVDPSLVDIAFNDVIMVKNGLGQGPEAEKRATEVLKKSAFTLTVSLNMGDASVEFYTCDLSLDYVKINADYRS